MADSSPNPGAVHIRGATRVTYGDAARLLCVNQPSVPDLTQRVGLQCLDARGRSIELPAGLRYDPLDPWAVEIAFGRPGGEVRWLVARELLLVGRTDPVGEGDVMVSPSIDEQGRAAVILELRSPSGRLIAQLATRELTTFLDRTVAAVPPGTEIVDLDGLVSTLLSAAE